MNVSKIGYFSCAEPKARTYGNKNEAMAATLAPIQNKEVQNFKQNLSFGVNFTTDVDMTRDSLKVRGRRLLQKMAAPAEEGEKFSEFDRLILNNIDAITACGKNGLPISYSRFEFSKNAFRLLPALRFDSVQSKMGINVFKQGKIFPDYWYEGFVSADELMEFGREGKLKEECQQFLYNNWASSNDNELNRVTNLIIRSMPEFINCVGKKQSPGHNYSLDIHSLVVMANIIKDPRYQELSDDDKFVLKMTALLHDIAKPEKTVDPYHPFRSRAFCNLFLKKYDIEPEINERILDCIAGHQWLQWYNLSNASPEKIDEIIEKYRSPEDYKMALIFAKADLAATSKEVYSAFSPLLEDGPQRPMREAVEKKFNMKF